jgi:hypothetical protein
MSEYQYYEFQSVDRPLDEAARRALRDISTRARITATSFTNTYQWGNLKADPAKLMERWFDLHLHVTNWGTRRLMIRLPKRVFDPQRLDPFLREVEDVTVRTAGDNLILDIDPQGIEPEDDDDGTGWLAALAPLRADLMSGDLRLLYLLWLSAVEAGAFEEDEPEPLPGIGPLTGPLEAAANFFAIDGDLVRAAAERPFAGAPENRPPSEIREAIAALGQQRMAELLSRLFLGEPHVAAELRAELRNHLAAAEIPPPRTVGELRARAEAIRLARERRKAEREAAEQRRRAEEAEKARRARIDALARRGESVWREIESEIERRNAGSYDRAAELLRDLQALAAERGTPDEFSRRLRDIRERHARKERFIDRLQGMG